MNANDLKAILGSPEALFILMLIASLSNGIKQLLVINQTGKPPTFAEYLSHWPETLAMLVANVIAFAVLIMTDQLNYASALGVGYGANSLADLLPGKRSLVLKQIPDDPGKLEKKP